MTRYPALVFLAAVALVAVLVAGTAGTGSTAEATTAGGFDGSNVDYFVAFGTIQGYQVDGEPFVDEMRIEAVERYHDRTDDPGDLSAVGDLRPEQRASEESETSARLTFAGDGRLTAHDDPYGTALVTGDAAQYVTADPVDHGDGGMANTNWGVQLTGWAGSTAVLFVVGDGEVTANGNGTAVARVEPGSTLVFRAYRDGRGTFDRAVENLIATERLTASAYVVEDRDEVNAGVATYGDAEVTATEATEERLTLDATDGDLLLATVPWEEAVDVTVDGAEIEEASLKSLREDEGPAYLVQERGDRTELLIQPGDGNEITVSRSIGEDDGSGLPTTLFVRLAQILAVLAVVLFALLYFGD